jgi:hypothetical protein
VHGPKEADFEWEEYEHAIAGAIVLIELLQGIKAEIEALRKDLSKALR